MVWGFIFVAVLFFLGRLAIGIWRGGNIRTDLANFENRITTEVRMTRALVGAKVANAEAALKNAGATHHP